MPTCAVAALLPKFDRAVARFNELDALREKPRRGGHTAAQLERKINAAWFRLRGLETRATEMLATSDGGITLQTIMAIADADTLHAWSAHELEANVAYRRLQRALASIVLSRDLAVLHPETVRFYTGSFDRGPYRFMRENTARRSKGTSRQTRGASSARRR